MSKTHTLPNTTEILSLDRGLCNIEAQMRLLDGDLAVLQEEINLPHQRRISKLGRPEIERRVLTRQEQLRILQATARQLHEMRCSLVRAARGRKMELANLPGADGKPCPARPKNGKLSLVDLWLAAFGKLPPAGEA